MVSFLVSLFVVDRQQRQWRLSQHSSGSDSIWFRLTHWSLANPEPYQDFTDATWKHKGSAAAQSYPETVFNGWYTRKKHRAVAKMEITDAFEMRGRVIAALLTWSILGVLALAYAGRRMYGWMVGS